MPRNKLISRIPPGVALLLIAPLLGELVSGHQGPLQFCNPLSFILTALPYGFGAVLCRELSVRWGRGRWNILPLALAYGLFEEGVVVRSFFNPDWSELGALQPLGYHGGVHWWFAFLLVHFHIIISIVASILLVELLYPEQRGQSWAGNRGLAACGFGLLLWIPAGFLMTNYIPPGPLYAGVWALIALLIAAARFLSWEWTPLNAKTTKPPIWFFLLGLVNVSATFFIGFILPDLRAISFLPFFIGLILLQAVSLELFLKWSGNGHKLDDRHRFAFLVGLLGFFILFGFIAVLEGEFGKGLVSLLTILALAALGRQIFRGNAQKQNVTRKIQGTGI